MDENEQVHYIGKMLGGAKRGDQKAAEALYRELYTPIFRYAYKRVRRKEDAEDIAQTVLMKLLGIADNREEISLAYVYQTARNAIIDLWRKEGKGMLYDDEIVAEIADTVGEVETDDGDKKEVAELLNTIDGEAREAIELRYLRELSTKEVAEVMGKSEEAVRQLLSRTTRKLRETVEKNISYESR